jgi:putative ABC transport system ATP-binding protein
MTNSSQSSPVLIAANALTKSYQRGREAVRALDGVSFNIQHGEFVAITGPSGAGKSTLLNILGCVDNPSSGTLELCGRMVHKLVDRERTELRRTAIGFVFQHFGLLPTLTVAENVALPGLLAHRRDKANVGELLKKVGLDHRHDHRPRELSGGEMQRVAIARALANQPRLLLADEPTGNLDTKTGAAIISLFHKLNQEGLTVIVVTHNSELANSAHRQIILEDGRCA